MLEREKLSNFFFRQFTNVYIDIYVHRYKKKKYRKIPPENARQNIWIGFYSFGVTRKRIKYKYENPIGRKTSALTSNLLWEKKPPIWNNRYLLCCITEHNVKRHTFFPHFVLCLLFWVIAIFQQINKRIYEYIYIIISFVRSTRCQCISYVLYYRLLLSNTDNVLDINVDGQ